MKMLPNGRPQASREKVVKAASATWKKIHGEDPLPDMFVVGIPAYYSETFAPVGNNRGVYDDAFFVIGPGGTFVPFNGNTDPGSVSPGMATLECPQVIYYKKGRHAIGKASEHDAFRQDSAVIVRRDQLVKPEGFVHSSRGISLGGGRWTDKDYDERFWCNNHKGGVTKVNSAGCLTVPPVQWDAYYSLVCREMVEAGIKRFAMILAPGPIH